MSAPIVHPDSKFIERHEDMVKESAKRVLYKTAAYQRMEQPLRDEMNLAFRAPMRQYSLALSLWKEDVGNGGVARLVKPTREIYIDEAKRAAARVVTAAKWMFERDMAADRTILATPSLDPTILAAAQAALAAKTAYYQQHFA